MPGSKAIFRRCDGHGLTYVRPPRPDEPVDRAWRTVDPSRDSFEDWEAEQSAPWPDDTSVLCCWLPTFWRR